LKNDPFEGWKQIGEIARNLGSTLERFWDIQNNGGSWVSCATTIVDMWNHMPPHVKPKWWMDLEWFILFFLFMLAVSVTFTFKSQKQLHNPTTLLLPLYQICIYHFRRQAWPLKIKDLVFSLLILKKTWLIFDKNSLKKLEVWI